VSEVICNGEVIDNPTRTRDMGGGHSSQSEPVQEDMRHERMRQGMGHNAACQLCRQGSGVAGQASNPPHVVQHAQLHPVPLVETLMP